MVHLKVYPSNQFVNPWFSISEVINEHSNDQPTTPTNCLPDCNLIQEIQNSMQNALYISSSDSFIESDSNSFNSSASDKESITSNLEEYSSNFVASPTFSKEE